jgi:hypothetical protein
VSLTLVSTFGASSDSLFLPLARSVRLGVSFCLLLDFIFEGVGCGLAVGCVTS